MNFFKLTQGEKTNTMKAKSIKYVVAWHYATGGGFDWYHTKEAQNEAFRVEKNNADAFRNDEWQAYKFTVEVELDAYYDEITRYIDERLDEFCADVNTEVYPFD